MSQLKVDTETLSEEYTTIGSRGLIAKIMNTEIPPDTDPLGPDSKLIIAAGPLAGTMAPQLGRISLGCKRRKLISLHFSNMPFVLPIKHLEDEISPCTFTSVCSCPFPVWSIKIP